MKKRFGKRAVTEVVSYSILIVIAVAISIFVYAFLRLYLPSENPECLPDTQLTIKSASCIAGNLNIVLENKGLHNVTSAFIRFEKADKDIKQQIADFLPKQLAPEQSTLPMSFAVSDIVGTDYGDYVVEVQTAIKKSRETVVCEGTVVTREVECIAAPTCGDGTCSPTEGCPVDATDCTTPGICQALPATCTNGCGYTNVPTNQQQTGICDDTTGCTTTPCECNGAGQCISQTAPPTCTDVDGDHYFLQSSGCDSEPGFLGHNDCDDGDKDSNPAIAIEYDCFDNHDNDCDSQTDNLDTDCDSGATCPSGGYYTNGECWYAGQRGESCTAVCGKVGGTCSDGGWAGALNDVVCNHFFNPSVSSSASTLNILPAFYSPDSKCYVRSTGTATCSPTNSLYHRLCKCDGTLQTQDVLVIYLSTIDTTSSTHNGALGGRAGADAICANEKPANLPMNCGNIHAFISVDANDEIRDMPSNHGYNTAKKVYWWKASNGAVTLLDNNWNDMLGSILSDQYSGTGVSTSAQSGSASFSGDVSVTENCAGFTSSSPGSTTKIGVSSTTATWISATSPSYTCADLRVVRCVAECSIVIP